MICVFAACTVAEDGAKADQYTREADRPNNGFVGLSTLHSLLYPGNDHPASTGEAPQGVQYIFVCRVVLGCTVATQDSERCLQSGATIDGSLWATPRKKELGAIAGASTSIPYHSLLAELGQKILRFREIVVFNGARVYPEYLVAYSRNG